MTLWGCEYPSTNHSDDMIEVWMGEPEPMILCGFHATQAGPAVYRRVRQAREQAARDAAALAVAAEKTPEQIAEIQRLREDPRLP